MGVIEKDVKFLVEYLNEAGIRFEDKTVLVTGGAGFLGSWICDVLVRQGTKVICLDNFSSGRSENVEHLEGLGNFKLVRHDISQPIFFGGFMERFDGVGKKFGDSMPCLSHPGKI